MVLGERHLRRVLRDHIAYYRDDRTHLGIAKATPAERPMEPRLDDGGANVVGQLRIGGLHHRYAWPSAA